MRDQHGRQGSSGVLRAKLQVLAQLRPKLRKLTAMSVQANLYPCAHCAQSGICKSGAEGASCAVCVRYHQTNNSLKGRCHAGLPCGTCGGLGQAEPGTERMTKRWPLILSLAIIWPLFIGIGTAAAFRSEFFTPLLAFSGPIVGGIVGFYFNVRSQAQP